MAIIHISFDYPDSINNKKTKAVKNLIGSQHISENIVFSLNRTATQFGKLSIHKEPHGYTLSVFGLPAGIFLFLWMFIAYKRIARIILDENINPTLIHAHKLTFEGIIAFLLSKKLHVPYILTFRGDSDIKVMYHKPLYKKLYVRIFQNAKKIIFLAPWALRQMDNSFGKQVSSDKYIVVPNIIPVDMPRTIDNVKAKKFITAFHFKNYRRKNIKRVIQAFNRVFSRYPDYGLDIVGGGSDKTKIIAYINNTNHPDKFSLTGELDNAVLLKTYSKYQGFILPSFPETFGLVFLEALTAGVPIIYSKNSGIDGYFDDYQIGIGVNHRSVDEIAEAIEKLILKNAEYAKNVEQMISSGFIQQFSQQTIGEKYSNIITQSVISGLLISPGN